MQTFFSRCIEHSKSNLAKIALLRQTELDNLSLIKLARQKLINDIYDILKPFHNLVLQNAVVLELDSSQLSLFKLVFNTNFQGKKTVFCVIEVSGKSTPTIDFLDQSYQTISEFQDHFEEFIVPHIKV